MSSDADSDFCMSGPSKDGRSEFEYVAEPAATRPVVEELLAAEPRLYGTPEQPIEPSSS